MMQVLPRGLKVGDEIVPLLSGEIQFWRLDVADWEPCLLQMKALGFEMVATYISWRRHTLAPGVYDFSGETDARLNVTRFLDLCIKHGLWVHFKPGPWICAEEINGGYPDFLIENEEALAVDSRDKPILGYNPPFRAPIPSYAHPFYRSHARRWLQAVKEHLAGYFYPQGPILLLQLDNEPSMTFHDRMFEGDYNPAITGCDGMYAAWLNEKYPAGAADVQAPRSFAGVKADAMQSLFDWVEFKEYLLGEHIAYLREVFDDDSMDVLYTVNANEHEQLATPNNWHLLQTASGLVGYDYYFIPPLQWRDCARMALALSYNRCVSPLVWAPELMTGIWISPGVDEDHPGFTLSDLEFYQRCAFALGLKGANFYMTVNRENWADAPVTDGGERGATYGSVKDLLELLHAIPDFAGLQLKSHVGVLYSRRDVREAYIAGADAKKLDGYDLGYGYRNFIAVFETLFYHGLCPAVVDFESGQDTSSGLELIFYTPGESIEEETLEDLLTFAAAGGTLVILTAREMLIGEVTLREGCTPYGSGSILYRRIDADAVCNEAQITEMLALSGFRPQMTANIPGVVIALHEAPESRVCFIINLHAETRKCTLDIAVEGVQRLLRVGDPGGEYAVANGQVQMSLPGRSVQAFSVL